MNGKSLPEKTFKMDEQVIRITIRNFLNIFNFRIYTKPVTLIPHKIKIVLIDDFITKLKKRIDSGLPGSVAHKHMSPSGRITGPFRANDYVQSKKASVLILIFRENNVVKFVMIQRPVYNGIHGGQVSFPGGKIEDYDASPWNAAVRETEEEIGVKQQEIKYVAELSALYIPPSNFFVYVFIGYMLGEPVFIPEMKEVESVIVAPIEILLDNTIKNTMDFKRDNIQITVPCYRIQNKNVWGATAIILSEVEELLRTL